MAQDADVQAAPREDNSARGSFARLKAWANERPWHMWVLIAIGLATLYLMWRIWRGQNSNTSGGFFAGLGGQPNNGPPSSGGTTITPPPPSARKWWDVLLHSFGNPSDTDVNDPANYNNEGYYTIGTAPGAGNTLAKLAAFFHLKGGIADLFENPHNKGRLPADPNAVLASGTEVWITRSSIQV